MFIIYIRIYLLIIITIIYECKEAKNINVNAKIGNRVKLTTGLLAMNLEGEVRLLQPLLVVAGAKLDNFVRNGSTSALGISIAEDARGFVEAIWPC